MKNKVQFSKARLFVLGIAGVFIILVISTLTLTFSKTFESENTDMLKNDQSVSVLQDKYDLVVDKFSSVINSFNRDNQVDYAIVSPDDTSCSAQELEEEYNKALSMNEVEFYNYLNDLYKKDVNYKVDNLPYFEDEMIKENETSEIGPKDDLELLN